MGYLLLQEDQKLNKPGVVKMPGFFVFLQLLFAGFNVDRSLPHKRHAGWL